MIPFHEILGRCANAQLAILSCFFVLSAAYACHNSFSSLLCLSKAIQPFLLEWIQSGFSSPVEISLAPIGVQHMIRRVSFNTLKNSQKFALPRNAKTNSQQKTKRRDSVAQIRVLLRTSVYFCMALAQSFLLKNALPSLPIKMKTTITEKQVWRMKKWAAAVHICKNKRKIMKSSLARKVSKYWHFFYRQACYASTYFLNATAVSLI